MKLTQNTPDCRFQAFDLFEEAKNWFEKAEKIRPPGNDDANARLRQSPQATVTAAL